MTGGVAASLQNLQKQDSDFWVCHKRKGCLFTLFVYTNLVVLFSWLLILRNVSCDCNFDNKENKKITTANVCCHNPPNKLNNTLCV